VVFAKNFLVTAFLQQFWDFLLFRPLRIGSVSAFRSDEFWFEFETRPMRESVFFLFEGEGRGRGVALRGEPGHRHGGPPPAFPDPHAAAGGASAYRRPSLPHRAPLLPSLLLPNPSLRLLCVIASSSTSRFGFYFPPGGSYNLPWEVSGISRIRPFTFFFQATTTAPHPSQVTSSSNCTDPHSLSSALRCHLVPRSWPMV